MDKAALQGFLENPECALAAAFREALQDPKSQEAVLKIVIKPFVDYMGDSYSALMQICVPAWLGGKEMSAKQFEQAVSKILNRMKTMAKSMRGIDAHRPQKNRDRDLKIWKLHQEHLDWSYTRIGRAVGGPNPISRSAVGAALLREQRRIQETDARIARFVKLLGASIIEYLDNQSLETKALPPGPTVQ